jgi:hypothetical protein
MHHRRVPSFVGIPLGCALQIRNFLIQPLEPFVDIPPELVAPGIGIVSRDIFPNILGGIMGVLGDIIDRRIRDGRRLSAIARATAECQRNQHCGGGTSDLPHLGLLSRSVSVLINGYGSG